MSTPFSTPLGTTPNEPVISYGPGSNERAALSRELAEQAARCVAIPLVVGGKRRTGRETYEVFAPHEHRRCLARVQSANAEDVVDAIKTAVSTQKDWSRWTLEERAAVFLRAADLLAGPWRAKLNAATMLGQSKTVHQAEIDSACELVDFLRFNVQFARQISQMQPLSVGGAHNSMCYRPLEGFVYAVTPFNFTAITGNLAVAPALMGNTVVWKPAATATLSNYYFMELLEAAGLPPGVINFVPGDPVMASEIALRQRALAGVHFTGSTTVFDKIWSDVGRNIRTYSNYPRLVGETGGKDFVLAHASASTAGLVTALVRGAFEYQGQKCSAASRAYIPESLWPAVREEIIEMVDSIQMGDVTDLRNFIGAVIDKRAYSRIKGCIDRARNDAAAEIVVGGHATSETGYFISPTVVRLGDPRHELMTQELFGPVLAIYVYPDSGWNQVLELIDASTDYALTGAVFAQDRRAVKEAKDVLTFTAGNFYINDKPTGAVVGQQPFGGARRSGTNDKAGSPLNLLRWTSPRTVKETFNPSRDYRYPSMLGSASQ